MLRVHRFIVLLIIGLVGVGPLSTLASPPAEGASDNAPPPVFATVYVFRPMGGKLATREMDRLADKIRARGLAAEVFGYTGWIRPANAAIARYRSEALKSPIIVIGHSAGGDSAIRFAKWLNRAGIPIDLIVTLDPTRIAARVPGNVERFVNIHSSTNMLGGGDPLPADDFHGHYASVDLKNYGNIWHIYLPQIAGLQDKVIDKIVAVAASPAVAPGPAARIAYPMPRGERIVLWDSGVPVGVEAGETAASIAARYGVPAWAIAAVNHVDPTRPLPAGRRLVVPRHLTAEAPAGQ